MNILDTFKKSINSNQVKKDTVSMMSGVAPVANSSLTARDNRRGIMVYDLASMMNTGGIDKEGKYQSAKIQFPLFRVPVALRIELMKICAPLQGLISGRMQQISTSDIKIVPIKDNEDRLVDEFKNHYSMIKEFEGSEDLKYVTMRARSRQKLLEAFPEMLPDLSNFNNVLLRWRKTIQNKNTSKAEEIEDWLREPRYGVTFTEVLKKLVLDIHLHSTASIFKKFENGRLAHFDVLPGGTVFKVSSEKFSNTCSYIQVVLGQGFDFTCNQYFTPEEIAYMQYVPTSSQYYPFVAVDALANKIIAYLLYDQEMANQADGTRPPEKILAVAKSSNTLGDYDLPANIRMSPEEQKRLQTAVNEPIRYPVKVIDTLVGETMQVIDISKENIMQILESRQDKIKQDIALIYNASPFEVGLTSSDFTAGKESSGNQQEMGHNKGIIPIMRMIEDTFRKDILPFRFGYGYMLEFPKSENKLEEAQLDTIRLNNGEIVVNELREEKGRAVFEGDEFNKPKNATQQTGQSEVNPLFTKQIQ